MNLIFKSDGFRLQIFIESFLSEILAESRLFESAERRRHIRLVVRVDKAGSGLLK